jgi:two-component system phosphate regulon sensor histidine kinase PhoR
MPESFREARRLIPAAALALAAGGAVVGWLGRDALWYLLGACLATLLAWRFLPAPQRVPQDGPAPAGSGGPLPPQTALLLERLPLPVMLLDDGRRILLTNREMRAALGQVPEDALERRHLSVVLRNPEVLEAVAGAAAGGEPGQVGFAVPGPVERHYEAHAARLGEGLVALVLHDITAIRRSEQMRADFVANASHELRTPLAAVSGFIETLRGHARDDEAAREKFLGIMAAEAGRMRRLIEDLLSLTRIELNEQVPPTESVALEPVLRQATAALAPLAAQDGIRVTVGDGSGLPAVTGDHDELVQLFQNLVHNAIKYGRPGGEVAISFGQDRDDVFVAVKDDGEGIPREALPRLTERFYRVDVKRSRERGGTGLGLAIVKHILSRHGGRLTIDSRVGEGSIFTIFLPVSRPVPAPENAQETGESAPVTEVL